MMGVYIKGMEMPTEPTLVVVYPDGSITAQWTNNYRKYKAIPIPPHGRLIDADALMLKILDYIEEYSDVDEKGWHNLKWCALKEAEMAINNAPTIIPASFENLPKSKDSQKIEEGD